MTEQAEIIRAKLSYHSWRRGIKEMDLILGAYANRYLPSMNEGELVDYASLLARHDRDLLPLLSDPEPPQSSDPDYALLMKIRAFIQAGGSVVR